MQNIYILQLGCPVCLLKVCFLRNNLCLIEYFIESRITGIDRFASLIAFIAPVTTESQWRLLSALSHFIFFCLAAFHNRATERRHSDKTTEPSTGRDAKCLFTTQVFVYFFVLTCSLLDFSPVQTKRTSEKRCVEPACVRLTSFRFFFALLLVHFSTFITIICWTEQ